MFKKALCSVLAVIMAVGVLASCNNNSSTNSSNPSSGTTSTGGSTSEEASTPAVDTSKKVEVIMWMTGTSPRDQDLVWDKVSELCERDLNCTLQFNMFNDSNTSQRMAMMLSSGEVLDLIYSAGYLSYPIQASQGAYLALDELVPKAAPDLWEYVSDEMWEGTKINGKIYMVPCMWKEFGPYGFLYREDLRKEMGVEVPNSLETIEAYMAAIRKNYPEQQVTMEMPSDFGVIGAHFSSWAVFDIKYKWADWRVPYGLYIDYEDPSDVRNW